MKGDTVKQGHAVVTLPVGVLPYYYCAYGVCGWIDAALEIYQAKNTLVKHIACRHKGPDTCRWEVYWE